MVETVAKTPALLGLATRVEVVGASTVKGADSGVTVVAHVSIEYEDSGISFVSFHPGVFAGGLCRRCGTCVLSRLCCGRVM